MGSGSSLRSGSLTKRSVSHLTDPKRPKRSGSRESDPTHLYRLYWLSSEYVIHKLWVGPCVKSLLQILPDSSTESEHWSYLGNATDAQTCRYTRTRWRFQDIYLKICVPTSRLSLPIKIECTKMQRGIAIDNASLGFLACSITFDRPIGCNQSSCRTEVESCHSSYGKRITLKSKNFFIPNWSRPAPKSIYQSASQVESISWPSSPTQWSPHPTTRRRGKDGRRKWWTRWVNPVMSNCPLLQNCSKASTSGRPWKILEWSKCHLGDTNKFLEKIS